VCVSLSIGTETRDGANVVHVEGELDVYTCPQLKEILDGFDRGGEQVVLDLSEVQFIDSTALGMLVAAYQRIHGDGGHLRLVADDPFLLKVFHITSFDGLLSIFPTVDDAISAR
jgi:anti-sigma B factor antagonist